MLSPGRSGEQRLGSAGGDGLRAGEIHGLSATWKAAPCLPSPPAQGSCVGGMHQPLGKLRENSPEKGNLEGPGVSRGQGKESLAASPLSTRV